MRLLSALIIGVGIGCAAALFLWTLAFTITSVTRSSDELSWRPPTYNFHN